MRVLDLALKDLSQIFRDWKAAAFLVAMPIAFTLLFGFVFSGSGGEEDARLPVGFLDEDSDGALSAALLGLLANSDAIRPVVLEDATRHEARKQVEDEELAAVVVVPAGYSAQVLTTAGGAALKPALMVGGDSAAAAAVNGVQSAVVRLLGAAQAARLSAQALEERGGAADGAFLEETLARALEGWEDPPLTVTLDHSGAGSQEGEESDAGANRFAHASAGIMVQFAIAGLIGAGEILVVERKTGAMRRLLMTPISRVDIILGHFLAMFIMVLLQLVTLVAFGQMALGVPYMQAPLATLLMVSVTALWAASLGLLIGTFAKTDEQVIIFALVLMMVLAGLGGAWMPLEFTSKAFQTVGHLTPTAWAIDGFENILVRGVGLESAFLPAAILLGFTLVFFGVAVWRFRFE